MGVKIDDVSIEQATETVEGWLEKPGKHYMVTPNPEILVAAQKDEKLKSILNRADLAIPDGAGFKFSGRVKNTTPGVDLMERLIKLSAEKGYTIGFLGGRNGVAERLAERLRSIYQNISITFAEDGGVVDNDGHPDTKYNPSTALSACSLGTRMTDTDLLFVAFGPPKQEKWIAHNLPELPVKVMMGVGGAFDYLSGQVPRAPKWIRDLGFEWLFRLIIQPWRIKRQLALIKYLWLLQQSN